MHYVHYHASSFQFIMIQRNLMLEFDVFNLETVHDWTDFSISLQNTHFKLKDNIHNNWQ